MDKNRAMGRTIPARGTTTNITTNNAASSLGLQFVQPRADGCPELADIMVAETKFFIAEVIPEVSERTSRANYIARHHEITQDKNTAIAAVVLQRDLWQGNAKRRR